MWLFRERCFLFIQCRGWEPCPCLSHCRDLPFPGLPSFPFCQVLGFQDPGSLGSSPPLVDTSQGLTGPHRPFGGARAAGPPSLAGCSHPISSPGHCLEFNKRPNTRPCFRRVLILMSLPVFFALRISSSSSSVHSSSHRLVFICCIKTCDSLNSSASRPRNPTSLPQLHDPAIHFLSINERPDPTVGYHKVTECLDCVTIQAFLKERETGLYHKHFYQ